jgi:hypothetical protein
MRHFLFAPLISVISLMACRDAAAPNFDAVRPACFNPAPLSGQPDPRAPGYIVVFEDNVDARRETNRLAALYGFSPRFVYEFALQGFSADLAPKDVAGIRCEASVKYVAHDGFVSIHGGG